MELGKNTLGFALLYYYYKRLDAAQRAQHFNWKGKT